MRILVLNYEFPPVGGGGGRVAEDLCRMMARHGHAVRVQTSGFRGLPAVEDRDGFRIFRSFAFRRHPDRCTPLEMVAFLATNLHAAAYHAATWKPNIIHAHFAVPTGVLAWLISRATRIPYVLTAHLGDVPGGVPEQTDHIFRIIKPFTIPIWREAAAVTAVSEHIRQLALRSYNVEVKTIYNGIELDTFALEPSQPHQPRRLVFAGRFNPQKNLLFLIDVLGRIRDLQWRIDLVGDGPQMGMVVDRIRHLDLSDRVCLWGWVDQGCVDAIMAQADVLVLPSLSEGMPVVGIRALGHGLVIIGSRVGGVTDLIKDDINGFLCAVNDHNAFERALRITIACDNRTWDMKKASRNYAKQFDLDQIARQYEDIFTLAAR